MLRGLVAIALLVLTPVALIQCGVAGAKNPDPHPDVTAADAPVQLVDSDDADLVLYVSNQSFEDERVRLTVVVDDVTVVDGNFHVADQHNWAAFPLRMPSGMHTIRAEADSGAALAETFRVPGNRTRYAVIDHWGEDESAELTWKFHRQPVAFA